MKTKIMADFQICIRVPLKTMAYICQTELIIIIVIIMIIMMIMIIIIIVIIITVIIKIIVLQFKMNIYRGIKSEYHFSFRAYSKIR